VSSQMNKKLTCIMFISSMAFGGMVCRKLTAAGGAGHKTRIAVEATLLSFLPTSDGTVVYYRNYR
jgi:hypothetical protein